MPQANTPHDALFKWTFSQVEHARAELRAVLPPAVLARLALDTLELRSGQFVDEALAASYSDLLFQLRIAGKPGLLFVLFEHQSSFDPLMPLRLLSYLLKILEHEARLRREAQQPLLPLPVVLPVVLHHSEQGWRASVQFNGLFDAELMADAEIARLVPSFEFVLDDLSELTDSALRTRALDQVTRLTLWALRDARSPERILRTVLVWLDALSGLACSPSGIDALRVIFRYISRVTQQPAARQVLKTVLNRISTSEDTMTTLAEEWKAEGRLEGKAEGRLEGKAEGRLEGKAEGRLEARRAILGELLARKFGALPAEASSRIAAANEEDLSHWTETLLSASSLDEVFAR